LGRKKSKFLTYPAGAFCPYIYEESKYDDWRDFVAEKLSNKKIILHDPRFKSNQLCPGTFTLDDMEGVFKSQIIFHARFKGYEDDGASWEHGAGFMYNLLINKGLLKGEEKLIIYADETNVPFPLHFSSANVTFNNLKTSIDFINSLDSLDKKSWIKIYNRLLDQERARK
jgi:hypothetical protein